MTSSSPIHHSRFPAQQGQAALLAVTIASSQAGFSSSLGQAVPVRGGLGKGIGAPPPPGPPGKRETGFLTELRKCKDAAYNRVHVSTLCLPVPEPASIPDSSAPRNQPGSKL